ncbi:MAG: hypothetical protein ABSG68_18385 [Thermoguttaceae bacterium]
MKYFRTLLHRQLLPIGLLGGLLAVPGTIHAGTVKVAACLANTHYFNQQNMFANVLLNGFGFGGEPGVDLTADGVSKRPGASTWYTYHPKLTPGMWIQSTDDPATWYRLVYHCDADVKKSFLTFQGFTVAKAPQSDGQGNWTGWLRFNERDVAASERITVIVNYAQDDLDAKGLSRHPISQLKILQPGLFFIQRWTDRNLPGNCCCSNSGYNRRTCRENGLPYEYCVRTCNDLNSDAWMNLPCTADDDYIRNFGNLMLYGSDPAGKVYTAPGGPNPRPANPPPGWYPPLKENLHCWVEYENEVWNWSYASFAYHQIKGQFHNRSTGDRKCSTRRSIAGSPAWPAAPQSGT